ncbi:hypothetical protein [Rhodococcus xishaensis]|uniref:Uncharacterized protein n=1 Tax=Rhodococcus xishaensis TaxID=2487364 RepID=A0A438AVB0_9NOCA|nr:hypothetical protein [Rhodococcus xishaensis]RVW02661.1 hypothetical protein EGT50_07750 [Rhodococcus xishaensis]
MNKIRAAAAAVSLGVLLLVGGLFVGGGVAKASPPGGTNPFVGWPEPARALVGVISQSLADVWNFFVGIANLIMFGV